MTYKANTWHHGLTDARQARQLRRLHVESRRPGRGVRPGRALHHHAFPEPETSMAYQVRRDFVGYGANPPDPKWPDGARLAVNFVLNYEEGSEPSDAGRRGSHRHRPDRSARHGPDDPGPRPRRREPVRVRQPGRLLAHQAAVPRTRAADDGLRLRAGLRAQSRGLEGDQRGGLRHLLARLALDQALRALRGGGARAHPQGDRLDDEDDRRAAERLVLPLRTRREHAPPGRRGRRLPLRFATTTATTCRSGSRSTASRSSSCPTR